jgi:hypothetical protein
MSLVTSTPADRLPACRHHRDTAAAKSGMPGILSELLKERPVAGNHAVDSVRGFGSPHWLTRQPV